MRKAIVKVHNKTAGVFTEENRSRYSFKYLTAYIGPGISLTMPVREAAYTFDQFPPFFDGLLPEGGQLQGLLKKYKLDKKDFFGQLLQTGEDLVGAVSVLTVDDEVA